MTTEESKIKILKEAIDNVNISLKLNKSNYKVFILRGIIREALDDFKGSINDFEFAIKYLEKDSTLLSIAYLYKGIAESNLGKINLAESLMDTAITYNIKNTSAYSTRGDIRIWLKKNDLACEDYRKALEMGENDVIDRIRDKCK